MDGPGQRQLLLRRHDGFDVEQAEAWRFARRAFDAIWIADNAAKHLIAAADAEHVAAAPDVARNVDVPALRTQEREIAARRF